MIKKPKVAKKSKIRKPKPLPPNLRAVKTAIALAIGDTKRAIRVSERRAQRAKGALAPVPEVFPKNDPRSAEHLTVVVYNGTPDKDDLPVDIIKWANFVTKYGVSDKASLPIRAALILGQSASYASSTAGLCTLYALLERGRAVDDMRRLILIASKAVVMVKN